MTLAVRAHPATPADLVHRAERSLNRQALLVAAVFAAVVWADQTSKGWAWRHLADVHINSGGNALTGTQLNGWLRDPGRGAVLDVLDAALLVAAGLLLARVRRRMWIALPAALALAGWSSNLLDRLGMHFVTAPGSERGAVDFLPWQGHYWNLADVAIVVGTAGLALAMLLEVGRLGRRPTVPVRIVRRPFATAWAPVVVAVGVSLTGVLAVIGAVRYGGTDMPIG